MPIKLRGGATARVLSSLMVVSMITESALKGMFECKVHVSIKKHGLSTSSLEGMPCEPIGTGFAGQCFLRFLVIISIISIGKHAPIDTAMGQD